MMNYKILSPEWVWLFDDAQGVKEVYGDEARTLIAQLEQQPTAGQEGGESDGAA